MGGSVAGGVLETCGLSGVKLYEPAALTLIAGAGTPLDEVEDMLAGERQCLPFEPTDHRGLLQTDGVPTIGGVAAANVSGPRRVKVGACRDHMLGVRFVDGRGTVIKNGGRVMKNVTGYDLVKLLAGSCGTLGVITEIAFKVLPKPDFQGVLLIYGLSDAEAVRAMSVSLGTPFNITGAAHAPRGLDGHPATMIRLEGFEEIVRSSIRRLSEQLKEFGDINTEYDQDKTGAGWKWIRDVAKFHGLAGDVWRIAAKPSDGPLLADRIRRQCDPDVVYDWGGGLLWLLVPEGSDVRSWLGRYEGHATLVRAKQRDAGAVYRVSARVRSGKGDFDGIEENVRSARHSQPRADGRLKHADAVHCRSVGDPGNRPRQPDHPVLRSLRNVQCDMPDLPSDRRRTRRSKGPDLLDQGNA